MRDERAFIEAILANPQDDALRLVYADWLDEQNDARGEFLRLRHALKGLPRQDERGPALRLRLREVSLAIPGDWVALVDRSFAEDDVREVIFRHLLVGSRGVSFLQAEGRADPSQDLLERLRESHLSVEPLSALGDEPSLMGGVINPKTGQRAIIVRVDEIRWISPRKCEVEGGYYADGLAASGNTYHVELRDGRWQVVDETMTWIS